MASTSALFVASTAGMMTGMSFTPPASRSVSSGLSALRMMPLPKPVRRSVGGKDAGLDGVAIAKVPDRRLDLVENDVGLRALVGLHRQQPPHFDECRFGVGFVEALGKPDEAETKACED